MAEEDNGFGEWGGYMEAKKAKLMEQYNKEKKAFQKDSLFSGISVFVNGRTDPPAAVIKRLMLEHGGVYHHYERHDTKFVIASNLCDVKVRNTSTAKIVSPQWITDCLNASRIVDFTNYLLYTDRDSKQPKIKSFAAPKADQSSTSHSSGNGQIFKALEALSESLNANISGAGINSTVSVDREVPAFNENKFLNDENCSGATSVGKSSLNNSDVNGIKGEQNAPNDKPLNISKPNNKSNAPARTAVDPQFLNEFFNNSRLHHIATLGAGFKKFICDLREKNKNPTFPKRKILKEKLFSEGVMKLDEKIKACVMHIDMDCFFVSVGLRDRPELKDKPVAVTHSKGGAQATDVPVHPNANRAVEKELFAKKFEQHLHNNILADKVKGGFDSKLSLSEIASCSYAAREKGIKNGMFVGEALTLCPDLITIPYDFEGYKEVATTLYNTLTEYTFNIEAVSCDEMFVDLLDIINEMQVPVMSFVKSIRDIVFERTRCTCSAGIGANKLQARMATKQAKPNGQYFLEEHSVLSYIENIPIKELPGVGYSTNHTLKINGFILCGDVQKTTKGRLQSLVGQKVGERIFDFCRGIDTRPLEYEHIRKSVSAEVNYGIRFKTIDELETFLKQLCAEVHRRLLETERSMKSITLKVMVRAKEAPVETSKFMGHGVCDNLTKTTKLKRSTQSLETITQNILLMMKSLDIPPYELRGIGITLANLDKLENYAIKSSHLKKLFAKMVEKVDKTSQPLPAETNLKACVEGIEKPKEETDKKLDKKLTCGKDVLKGKKIDNNCCTDGKDGKKNSKIFTMFQAAVHKNEKQKEVTPEQKNLGWQNNIDPEVFIALPEDIKKEILSNLKNKDAFALNEPNSNPAVSPTSLMTNSLAPASDAGAVPLAVQAQVKNLAVNLSMKPFKEDANLTPLNESDYQPSTSKAAAERRLLKEMKKVYGEGMDPEFLTALPDDIREEIARDMAKMKMNQENQIQPYVPFNSIASRRSDNIENEKPKELLKNSFQSFSTNESLTCWIELYEEPEILDIKLFTDYCYYLIENNAISELFDKLVHVCRLIMQLRQDSCVWHTAFKILYTLNQDYMVRLKQKRLFFNIGINCDKCASLPIKDSPIWFQLNSSPYKKC